MRNFFESGVVELPRNRQEEDHRKETAMKSCIFPSCHSRFRSSLSHHIMTNHVGLVQGRRSFLSAANKFMTLTNLMPTDEFPSKISSYSSSAPTSSRDFYSPANFFIILYAYFIDRLHFYNILYIYYILVNTSSAFVQEPLPLSKG